MNNLWKLYLYRALSSFTFVSPIFVLFLQDNGLSMTQVMALQAIYSLTTVAFLIIGGSVADFLGRKKVLVLSSVLSFAGWLVYSLGHNFIQFVAAEIVLGVSLALWESSFSAWLYDSLKEQNEEKQYKRVFGNTFAVMFLAVGLAAPVGSYLASFDLRLPFFATIIPVALSMFVIIGFREPEYHKKAQPYFAHIRQTLGYCWNRPRTRNLILFGSIAYSSLFSAFFLYQPYFAAAGLPIVYFGIVYFGIEATGALGAKYAHKIEGRMSEKRFLLLTIGVPVIGFSVMLINPIAGIVVTILLSLVSGMLEPVITDYIHIDTESYHRATVLAIYGTAYGIISSILMLGTGYVVDHFSINHAIIGLGLVLALNLLFLAGIKNKAGAKA